MKMWSRGLGRTEINMDFRYYQVSKDPGNNDVWVSGTITDPVNWEFRIIITPEDIPGILKLAFSFTMIKLFFLNAYRYLGYLFNKKKYLQGEGNEVVEKVTAAYQMMMSPEREKGGRSLPKRATREKRSLG